MHVVSSLIRNGQPSNCEGVSSGYIGMWVSVHVNVRVSNVAKKTVSESPATSPRVSTPLEVTKIPKWPLKITYCNFITGSPLQENVVE